MSQALTIDTNLTRYYYPNPTSNDAEEQAVIQFIHKNYANYCLGILKQTSTFEIPARLRMCCPISDFTPILQVYLFSKGCTKTHSIEIEIDFNEIINRINKSLQGVNWDRSFGWDYYTNRSYFQGEKISIDKTENKSNYFRDR